MIVSFRAHRWALLASLALAACATSLPIRDYRDAEALSDQALALMNAGSNAEAVKLLNRVISYNGGEVRDLTRRAAANAALSQYPAALQDLDRSVARAPHHWQSYLLRATANQKLGRFTDAVHDLDAALEIKPEDPELIRQRAYVRLLAGQFADAAADYDTFAQLRPESGIGPFGRGVALYLATDWPGAAIAFDHQLRRRPGDGILALWLVKASLKAHSPLAWEQVAAQAGPEPEWAMVRDLLDDADAEGVSREMTALRTRANGRRTVGGCEALYLGTWAAFHGLGDRAQASLDSALDSCPTDSIENMEARTELGWVRRTHN